MIEKTVQLILKECSSKKAAEGVNYFNTHKN